jgi:preprotein translocase subunit SecA
MSVLGLDRSLGTARLESDDTRLWDALGHPFIREQPAKGLDLAGERIRALSARRRASRADARRAEAIIDRAGRIAKQGETEFTSTIEAAHERAARRRDDASTINEAFSVAYEAIRREIGLSLHPEQVVGALAMSAGRCAEMATGEGKTVTAILPAALDGWVGRGVHVVTVNDYLARRDAQITGPAYKRLGLSVGVLQDGSKPAERRNAYDRAVTYAADKQVIFDFLRDRLVAPLQSRLVSHAIDQLSEAFGSPDMESWRRRVVQRGLHAAIVDEADSVLIDEAVTPAIIGQDGAAEEAGVESHYRIATRMAAQLVESEDYRVDLRLHRVFLTDQGRERLASMASLLPAFWSGPRRREELLLQALTAAALYKERDDYIVRDGKVVIVDRSTGRVLEGRQWQLGVHQAIEAKEGLDLTPDRRTVARVSYQRFFQRYHRLCGMTGTGWEVAGELWQYYRLPVTRVPTHKPVIRKRSLDRSFLTEERKFEAVADRVQRHHDRGRPVLVGTRSVESSERLGELLAARGIECRILNATREAEEASIVADAGREGAVTVATNMAGRGTDIILDDRTRELGGLVVIATERHDERRVDRQLFGRSGRQGDPGLAETFMSIEDSLIRRHSIGPLLWLYKRTHGPVRRLVASVLWPTAQWTAGRRACVIRNEVAKMDAWIDLSMHHESR